MITGTSTDFRKNPKKSEITTLRESAELVSEHIELLYNIGQQSEYSVRSEELLIQIERLQTAAKAYIKFLK